MAEVSRGTQVPCLEFKVFSQADGIQMHHRVTPINFFVFEPNLQNNVTDLSIDNHIFPECQGKRFDLKVARPVDEKIDFQLKSCKIFLSKNLAPDFT